MTIEVKDTHCPICNSNYFHKLKPVVETAIWMDPLAEALERKHFCFDLGQCLSCGHIMIIDENYTLKNAKMFNDELSYFSASHSHLLKDAISWIKELSLPNDPVVIDFGCGGFSALQRLKEYFLDENTVFIGVDFNPLAFSSVPPDIHFVQCDLHQLGTNSELAKYKFNVGYCSSVLEHVFEPRKVVVDMASLMFNENSWIYIELPVIDEISRCTGLKCEIFSTQHIHYFTSDNLQALFTQCGLTVVKKDVSLINDFPRGRFLLTRTKLNKTASDLNKYVKTTHNYQKKAAEFIIDTKKNKGLGKRIIIWGVGLDLHFMTKYNSELLDSIKCGAIELADSSLKGSEWLGSMIRDPEDLSSYADLIILAPRAHTVRKDILINAKKLGFNQYNTLDPYEEYLPAKIYKFEK